MSNPKQADEQKAGIEAAMRHLAALSEAIGLQTTARDIRDVRLPKLQQERFSLVILGEFNHGKSTFLNALLGEPLLPMGAIPTTAAVAELSYGEHFAAQAVYESGTRQALSRDELSAWLRGQAEVAESHPSDLDGDVAVAVERIEIELPAPFLSSQLTVVDTPGVNDLSEQRADITYGYVPRADAIVFLLDATQVLTASERRFLHERVVKSARQRLVFVIAKADLLDEQERQEVELFAREQLEAVVPAPEIFFVSAKRALRARVEALEEPRLASDPGGLEVLRVHLNATILNNRRRVLFDHALEDCERLWRFLTQTLAMRRASLALPLDELSERAERARARLADSHRVLSEANHTIKAEGAALKARVQHDLSEFIQALSDQLPVELEAAQPKDVQIYLSPFLEDTVAAWLAHEGRLMGKSLEALAEKVIAVAAEKLDALAEDLNDDLGDPAEDISVQIPGLPEEASVFAFGALGGTALLFFNTVAGGAAVLLTPALAALVRARALAAAKDETMARVPEVVSKIGSDLSVRLDETVDAFTARLETFISEAGATLARGVLEILQAALDVREGRAKQNGPSRSEETDSAVHPSDATPGADEAALQSRLDGELRDLGAQINHLRESVWQNESRDGTV